ncbi:tRNA dihydrouridine synthase [Marinomonas algicola]|uniref:tRNA dihydrouridine synthase n=1 Tax=Marinomonas algicola TaxID=2773454 RepID=UPI00174B98E1|nr:tRNA-dihydrouridine synthase family protein [Marinomonas algicola]
MHQNIKIAVAPMEGIMDHTLRQLLSEVGGMDYFVSEFVRVTQYPIPSHTFHRLIPENTQGATTKHKHPVHTQLLGSVPDLMALSAANAIESGSTHIDVNFGCPAKRVNGHGGGSVLLQSPNTLYDIMSTIKKAIPSHIPLSAKIRLGYEDESRLFENVSAIELAGTQSLTIHGRTKKDGYRPPARWEKIGKVKEHSKMKIIANGDITSTKSLLSCLNETKCSHFMIGRGVLINPFIFQDIKSELSGHKPLDHSKELEALLTRYIHILQQHYDEVATLGRLKQWCGNLRHQFIVIEENLTSLRQSQSVDEFINKLASMSNAIK